MKIDNDTALVWTDGATVGHNGKLGTVKEVGLGIYVFLAISGHNQNNKIEFKRSIKKRGGSNNEAEFMALIDAMDFVLRVVRYRKAIFYSDSRIIVNRANMETEGGNQRMVDFQEKVLDLASQFDEIEFQWIPREQNEIADELSKKACYFHN